MWIYFLFVRLAALFGHRKAKMLVQGQAQTIPALSKTIQPDDKVIWFHASSVGEFEQAIPLIEMLHKQQPQYRIVATFFSPSGYNHFKNYELADVFYLPFASRTKAHRFVQLLRPKMVFFVKYDLWPAYLKELKEKKIPTYLISSIFRPSQFFFSIFGGAYLNLLHCFTHIFVQNEASKKLLGEHGVKNVTVMGDTRFDRVDDIANKHQQLPIVEAFVKNAQKVIVAGSTWPKDEVLLARYLENRPDVRLILAPHELNEKHLQFIFQLFEGRYANYSQTDEHNSGSARILLIDVIGKLSSIYAYGDVAYIGGGFGKGIHNTLEAAVYGVPVLFVTNYKRFREACDLVENKGGFVVKNYKTLEENMDYALDDCKAIGKITKAYVQAEKGTTQKIYNFIWKA